MTKQTKRSIRRGSWYAAEIAAALMWGPKSRPEICEAVGLDPDVGWMIQKYLDEFKESGTIYIAGFTRLRHPIYGWQPKPFALPDAEPTDAIAAPVVPFTRPSNGRTHVMMAELDGVLMPCPDAARASGWSLRKVYAFAKAHRPLTRKPEAAHAR